MAKKNPGILIGLGAVGALLLLKGSSGGGSSSGGERVTSPVGSGPGGYKKAGDPCVPPANAPKNSAWVLNSKLECVQWWDAETSKKVVEDAAKAEMLKLSSADATAVCGATAAGGIADSATARKLTRDTMLAVWPGIGTAGFTSDYRLPESAPSWVKTAYEHTHRIINLKICEAVIIE